MCLRWWLGPSPPSPWQGSSLGTAWTWTPCGTADSWPDPERPSSSGRCRVCRSGACRPTWQAPGTGHSIWHRSGPLSGSLWRRWQQWQQPSWGAGCLKSVHADKTQQNKVREAGRDRGTPSMETVVRLLRRAEHWLNLQSTAAALFRASREIHWLTDPRK